VILIDTNVLLDLVADDPLWAGWSQQQLDLASAQDELAINDIVYAELSVGYARMEQLDECDDPQRRAYHRCDSASGIVPRR
jgi:predicted nucleic acid-binding protein